MRVAYRAPHQHTHSLSHPAAAPNPTAVKYLYDGVNQVETNNTLARAVERAARIATVARLTEIFQVPTADEYGQSTHAPLHVGIDLHLTITTAPADELEESLGHELPPTTALT